MSNITIETRPEVVGKRVFLTEDGEDLLVRDPEVIADFLDLAFQETYLQRQQPVTPHIGEGQRARVTELPGSDLCLKVSGPWSGRKAHQDGRPIAKPSLIQEMRFMDLIRRRLANSDDNGLHIPRMLASVRTNMRTTAMLLERLPDDATCLSKLGNDSPEKLKQLSERVEGRFFQALGLSALRFGVGDLRGRFGVLNTSNVFLNRELDPDGDIYFIDLVGKRNGLSALAMGFLLPMGRRLPTRIQPQ